MTSENQEPAPVEALSSREAADRIVDDWPSLKGWGVHRVVDPSGAQGAEVLRAVRERVPDSVLVDAAGRTADDVFTEVVTALGARFKTPAAWSRRLPKKPARLVLLVGADLVGSTRTSGDPRRLLQALNRLGGLGHTVFAAVRDPEFGDDSSRSLRLAAEPPVLDEVPAEVLALALAEARHVPYAVWRELVAGLTGQRPDAGRTADLATEERARSLLLVDPDAETVSFRDETVARTLRGQLPAEDRARTHHHLAEHLADRLADHLADVSEQPAATGSPSAEGPAEAGSVVRYATTALAAHCAAADLAAGDTTYTRFTQLLRRTRLVAHLAPESLLEAAEGAGLDEAPGGSVLADAVHARDYALLPCDQGTWVAWLHLQATVRGDTELADGLAAAGVRTPWRVTWTRWRPPAALHLSYLAFSPVTDLMELRLDDRPVAAAVAYRDRRRHVTLYDPRSGEELAAAPWELGQDPEEALPGLRWPTAGGEDDRPEPEPVNGTLLDAGPVSIGDSVVIAGHGGLFGIESAPGTPFTGITRRPGGRVEAACPALLKAPATVPRHGPAPRPADLDTLFAAEDGTLVAVPEPLLPAGLTHAATRDFLVDQGIPAFRDVHGLGFFGLERDPDWWSVAHGTHTGPPPPRPERLLREIAGPADTAPDDGAGSAHAAPTGPYFRIGLWMGDDVVVDGPTGAVLHLPDQDDEAPGRAEIVGRSLHDFLAMVSVWLLGVHVFTDSGDSVETREVASRVKGLQSTLDPVGAAAGIWGIALMDH
ncbi:SUKH-4 family immunity protein [Streptomyces sp. NPDC001904]|uniref:SUKH-4 family immunity protein n=1 Tax=Streptomyces sp. NPDC001904 TaxID=3154531 RepID=UPI0033258DD3